jgi:hypothetical protein
MGSPPLGQTQKHAKAILCVRLLNGYGFWWFLLLFKTYDPILSLKFGK